MSTARKTAFAVIAALGVLGLPSVNANTQDDSTVPRTLVNYSDLNLSTDEGVSTLYRRLQAASRQVCRMFDTMDLSMRSKWQSCYDQALTHAVAEVNQAKLTALHNKRLDNQASLS